MNPSILDRAQRLRGRDVGVLVVGGGLALAGLVTALSSSFSIHERERGVVTRNGAFSYVASPGWQLKLPFLDSVESVDLALRVTRLDNLETFTTGDQPQEVHLTVRLSWIIPPSGVERVWRLGQANVEQQMSSMAADRVKQVVGRHHATAIPSERTEIVREVFERVRDEASRLFGVTVLDLQIVNIDYSAGFRAAVDAAAQATQVRAQRRTEAETVEEVAKGQANAAIEAARGAARARELAAIAEAQATRIQGEATAASITAQQRALGESPNYVALRQAERWDGRLPQQMLSGAPVPFVQLGGPR